MKNIIKLSIPILLLFLSTNLQAFVLVVTPESNNTISEEAYISVAEFLQMTPETWAAETGKKTTWTQRKMLKIAQKRMKKKLSKGKIQPGDNATKKGEPLSLSWWSLICAGVAALFIQVALALSGSYGILIFGILALLIAVAGLVFGIKSLKVEEKKAKSVIGLLLSGLVLLFWAFITLVIIIWQA